MDYSYKIPVGYLDPNWVTSGCVKKIYIIFYIILIHGYIEVFFDFPFYINKNNTIVYIRHNIS